MHPNHRSRTAVFGMAAMLAFTFVAPVAVNAQDQSIAMAPDSGPSWDESSGYASVEASRAAISGSSWYAPADSNAIEETRVMAARQALLTEDLGSMQEEALTAIVAPAPSWDDTSGYGSVEATRAAISALPAAPGAVTTLDPAGIRWAPDRAIAPAPSVEATRVIAAQRALLTGDIGSMQEEALTAIVAASPSWDEMSGYGSVEASRAAASALFAPSSGGSDFANLDEAELLSLFRAIERSIDPALGGE